MILRSYLFSCLTITLLSPCRCLYEDQLGKFDWKKSLVGNVLYSRVDLTQKHQRVYVATESNVVAALSIKGGHILWRHVLENGEHGAIKGLFAGTDVVTISGNGPFYIRGWNKTTGIQLFESSSQPVFNEPGMWTADKSSVYQVYIDDESKLHIANFPLERLSSSRVEVFDISTWDTTSSRCTVFDGSVACVSTDGNFLTSMSLADLKIKTCDLQNGQFAECTLSGKSDLVAASAPPSNRPSDFASIRPFADGVQIISKSGTSLAAVFDSSRTQIYLKKFFKPAHISSAILKDIVLSHATANAGLLTVKNTIINLKTKTESETEDTLMYNFRLAEPVSSSSSCIFDLRMKPACYSLYTMEDQASAFIRLGTPGDLLWVREEALAKVTNVEMVALPVSQEEAAIENEFANQGGGLFGMLFRRISSQLMQLQTLLLSIVGLLEPSHRYSGAKVLVKDVFGLHKLIVVVTEASKIFAIDSDDGEVIWQTYVEGVTYYDSLDEKSSPLFILRTARHLLLSPKAAVLFKNKETGNGFIYEFNPITGERQGRGVDLKKQIVQCMMLPQENDKYIRGLVLLENGGSAVVFPESTLKVALNLADSLYMSVIDPQTSFMLGYKFLSDGNALKSSVMWKNQLPGKVIRVVGKRSGEKVHSQGRVLGDRSVLYKYVNPNLIAVATVTYDPIQKNTLNILLIDSVNGAIAFSLQHKRVIEPIHLVHSENLLVYTYFNDKSRRTEIVTLDMYEGKSQRNTTVFSSLDPPIEPLIDRQAYIFPHSITAMKDTTTEKGITNKHILVGLSSGGVMEIPWVLLDARRSVTLTPEMREEGVVPYIPEISLPHETIITYNHTLPLITGIHTSPSGLESTCLVFIYGLDLFYTRVAPSKTFDVLKDDFEYWLITAVLSGLVAAAYVTKRLSSRKALRQSWK